MQLERVYRCLDVKAELTQGRLPIVIDGLNESLVEGRLSRVWRKELEGFVSELQKYTNLALITTCRSAYVDSIWPDGRPENAGYDYRLWA